MSKIGLFGGTFNPIHNGHILFLQQIKEKYCLDKVILMPSNIPPHKYSALATNNERFKMCKLATEEIDYIAVSDIEYKLSKKSYTSNTLKILKKSYPNDEIYLIIGPDMLLSFDKWYEYNSIIEKFPILSGTSSKYEYELMTSKAKELGGNISVFMIDILKVSSTYIRIKYAQGESCAEYLNKKVAQYIFNEKIYMKENSFFVECYNTARNQLSKKRFKHCLMVAKAAKELAKIYNENEKKAEIAGLLHDIMKEKDNAFLLHFMAENDIILSKLEKNCPKIWHSTAGAVYCEKYLGIEDEDIINAIRYHTTAKEGMSKFEKIIYIADCISDDRKYKEAEIEREMVKKDLNMAIFYHLKNTIINLCEQKSVVHPDTVNCYNELCADKTN